MLIGVGLLAAAVAVQKYNEPRDASKSGSLGGTDDLLGYQGFDVDPNSVPDQPNQEDQVQYESYPSFYVITPEGEVVPESSPVAGTSGEAGLPADVPIASTGTGSLFQDAAATGGAIGANLMLPSIAKRVTKLVDTNYLTDAVSSAAKQSPWKKLIKDPYNLNSFNDLATSKAQKTGSAEVTELAIDKSGKTILKTAPKWAKGLRTVANFIPLIDIPIGAGLDVYFNRYEADPTKKINWGDAIAANTAGELAQLGITTGGAAAGTVVPVAGNVAGGVTGFVVGTAADITATEAYYAARGKSSLFVSDKEKVSGDGFSVGDVTKVSKNSQTTNFPTVDLSQPKAATKKTTTLPTIDLSKPKTSNSTGSTKTSKSSKSSKSSSSRKSSSKKSSSKGRTTTFKTINLSSTKSSSKKSKARTAPTIYL